MLHLLHLQAMLFAAWVLQASGSAEAQVSFCGLGPETLSVSNFD